MAEADVLALTAAVERESEHPLATAVAPRHAEGRGVPASTATGFRNVPGHGAGASVNALLLKRLRLPATPEAPAPQAARTRQPVPLAR